MNPNLVKKYTQVVSFRLMTFAALLLGCILLFSTQANAQTQSEYERIDSVSYTFYQQQQWEELIEFGSESIKNGFDYYYMQMRVGIAYYETGNYRKSVKYFENADKLYPANQLTIEYLYYSYFFSGRNYDATRILNQLTPENRERLGIEKNFLLDEIYLEGGLGFANDDPQMQPGNNGTHPNDTIYNAAIYYDDLKYFQGGVKLRIHPNISTYQGYSYVTLSTNEQINSWGVPLSNYNSKPLQQEYYGNLGIALPTGIKITPAWHFIWLNYEAQRVGYTDSTGLSIDTVARNLDDFSFSFSARKDFSLFALEINGVYSSFGIEENKQIGLSFFTYPLGDVSLYTQTSLIEFWNQKQNQLIFYQMVGARVLPNVWLEAEASIGNLRNYSEKNGFVVYNIPEDTKYKLEASILVSLNKHLDLSFRYRLMRRVNKYLTYTDLENSEFIETDYNFNTIIGGLTWRF